MKDERYVLGDSEIEIERLEIQSSLLEPFAYAALLKAGIRKGMKCIDVGCGSGSVSRLMGQIVEREGHVLGIDLNEAFIQYCRKVNTQKNTDYVCDNIYEARLLDNIEKEQFDLVYCRLLFLHTADVDKAVQSVVRLIKKGGTILIQEFDHGPESWLCYPQNENVEIFRQVFVSLIRKIGGDPLVGRKIFHTLTRQSLDTSIECYSPCMVMGREPYNRLGYMLLESLKPFILSLGLLTEKEYAKLYEDLKQLSVDRHSFVTYARLFSVIGRK